MRGLIRKLAERISRIEILETVGIIEKEPDCTRKIGYELLRANFQPIARNPFFTSHAP